MTLTPTKSKLASAALRGVLTLVLVMLASSGGSAQQNTGWISGRVLDAGTAQPLEGVQVLVSPAGADAIAGGVTGPDGTFRVERLPSGAFAVTFSRLGYTSATRPAVISASTRAHDFGTVMLVAAPVMVEGLVVAGERPAVVHAEDRDIYAADALAASTGGSAADLLGSVPDLEVEPNGAVSMRGATPAIYINGRPAPLQGESLQDFLQQFPAEHIESVEVMANPSARYEAEGAGGIVNIVLKRDARLGLHGNGFLNIASGATIGAGGRVTFQDGPLTLIGGGSLRQTARDTRRVDLRQNLRTTPHTYLEQDAATDRTSLSGNFDLQAIYALGANTTLTGEGKLTRRLSDSERLTFYTQMDSEFAVTDHYDRLSLDDGRGLSGDLALELKHVFRPRQHELSGEIEYNRALDSEESLLRQRVSSHDPDREFDFRLTEDTGREHESELGMRVDYVRPGPFGIRLETGYRGQYSSSDDVRLRRAALEGQLHEQTPAPRGGLGHERGIQSLYATGQRRIGDLSAQLGLRLEHAASRFEFPDQPVPVETAHLSWFPSANLTYPLGDGRRLRLSYSQRVRRPSANVVNPLNRSNDPMNRRVGNPDIDPQYTHSWNLDASWSGRLGTLRVAPFYQKTVDEWAQLQTVADDGVATTTWENVASTAAYGTSVTISPRARRGIGGSLNMNTRREERDFTAIGEVAPRVATRTSFRANLDARATGSLTLQGSLAYNAPRDLPQGRASGTLMSTAALRYRVLGNRATLNANVSDPLGLYRPSTLINAQNYVEVRENRESTRRFTLSVSYNFGRAGNARGSSGGGRGR